MFTWQIFVFFGKKLLEHRSDLCKKESEKQQQQMIVYIIQDKTCVALKELSNTGLWWYQDTLSVVSTQDSSEISRLQQELASAEMAHTSLAESFTSLEHERQKAEQSVWMTQGELNALRDQLKTSASKFQEMQDKYTALEQRYGGVSSSQVKIVFVDGVFKHCDFMFYNVYH